MKKFLSISILTLLVLTVLSGCQLAKKENTPSAVTKHLVGIYCTATPLDDQEEQRRRKFLLFVLFRYDG